MEKITSSLLVLCLLCLVLGVKQVDVLRTSPQPLSYLREARQSSQPDIPTYSEELKSLQHFDSIRTTLSSSLQCRTPDCNRKRKPSFMTTIKPVYLARKVPTFVKNETKYTKPKARFSRKFDPSSTDSKDSQFVPVDLKKRTSQRRARHKVSEDMVMKESRTSENILGNGNFEILTGGVYADEESNEIPEGRRMGRGFDTYSVPQFQRMPFNVPSFEFPSFFRNRQQLPTHPMFFPRAAY